MAYKRTSPMPVEEGGTAAITLTDHAVIVGSGVGAVSFVGPVASTGSLLASAGVSSDPGFTTATYPLTTTANQILYSSATNTVSEITTAANGVLITNNSSVPSLLAAGTTGQVLTATTGAAPSWGAAATGDVTGPGSSTDRAIATWNGTGGDTLFDNPTITISSAGEMVNTAQPAFSAYLGTTDTNQTGDGTVFYLGDTAVGTTLTEIYDQNSDFTPGASGGCLFTSPVTGKYLFDFCFSMNGIAVGHTICEIRLETSNRTYLVARINPSLVAASGSLTLHHTCFADMDTSDTAKFNVLVSGSTKTVNILPDSAGTIRTYAAGNLIC